MRFVSGRWWRTLRAKDPVSAQASLDRFLTTTGDARERRTDDGRRTTVGALADAEPLMALPAAAYPATIIVERTVADNATVAFRGNHYSVPPGLSARSSKSATGCPPRPSRCTAPRGSSSPATSVWPTVWAPSSACPSTARRSSPPCSPPSPPSGPATARPTGPRAPRPSPRQTRLLGAEGRDVVVDLARYAELVEVTA